jgi:Uri superfamily endonuclease
MFFVATSDDAPACAGAYVLWVTLCAPLDLLAPRPATLGPGRYLYCGSAKGPGGLRARLGRHMRHGKAIRWHIDRLTEAGEVPGAWVFPDGDECALAASLTHLPVPVPGFGSSDCRHCPSHLFFWRDGASLPWGETVPACRFLRPHGESARSILGVVGRSVDH